MALARDHGVSVARMAGATLLVYASWSGCLLGIGCLAMLVTHKLAAVAAILLAGSIYLTIIVLQPRFLARNKFLAPLFEAGLLGDLVALAVRAPHAVVLFFGTWLPFLFFGVNVPFATALTLIPIVMIAVTLPITPQGLGTRDVLAGTFFAAFAPGPTPEDRLAVVLAVTTTWGVAVTLVDALVGLALLRYRLHSPAKPRAT